MIPTVIGGDFNCRVAELNQVDSDLGQLLLPFYCKRKSFDSTVNSRERVLVEIMESNGFVLLNGRSNSDFPGCFSFIGPQGESVVDHVWCSIDGLLLFRDFEVMKLVTFSDHLPIKVDLHISSLQQGIPVGELLPLTLFFDEFKSEMFTSAMTCRSEVRYFDYNVSELNSIFTSVTRVVAKALGMIKADYLPKSIFKSKPWFDNECRFLKKDVADSLKLCRRSDFSLESKILYLVKKIILKRF